MNSFIEHPVCDEVQGYTVMTAAVSYAQSLGVVVPCSLERPEDSRYLIVYELPHAFACLEAAAQSIGLAMTATFDDIVSMIADEVRLPQRDTGKIELVISFDNLSTDFGGNEGTLGIRFRQIVKQRLGNEMRIRYTLCGHPLGMNSNQMPASLSSYSAHLRYAKRGTVGSPGDVPIHFNSEGYLLGPEDGVVVAVTGQGTHCCSASRPILAMGTARRLEARGLHIVEHPLHLSELVMVSHMGWVDRDFRLFGAELRAGGRPERFDGVFDGVPEDLASISMQDDIHIKII